MWMKNTSTRVIRPLCWMDILCKVLSTLTFCFHRSDFDLGLCGALVSQLHLMCEYGLPPIAWSQSVTDSLPCHACVVCSVSDHRSSSFQSAERSCMSTNDTKVMSVVACKLLWKSFAPGIPVDVFFVFVFCLTNKTHLKRHYRRNKLSLATKTLWVISF